jgi:hypothetical protein
VILEKDQVLVLEAPDEGVSEIALRNFQQYLVDMIGHRIIIVPHGFRPVGGQAPDTHGGDL